MFSHSSCSGWRAFLLRSLRGVSVGALIVVLIFLAHPTAQVFPFQSHIPRPPSSRPTSPHWVPKTGGLQEAGAVKVVFPNGFTDRSGADVHVDVIHPPMFITDQKLVHGTQFALGIWQVPELLKPIDIQVMLDAVHADLAKRGDLVFMIYDPRASVWKTLPTRFRISVSQLTTSIQRLDPIPRDSPAWGDRTFIGVFVKAPVPEPTNTQIPKQTPVIVPTLTLGQQPNVVLKSTVTPIPTYTSYPTYTPYPTPSLAFGPALTYTPLPTYTPYPTFTPAPQSRPSICPLTASAQVALLVLALLFVHRGQ